MTNPFADAVAAELAAARSVHPPMVSLEHALGVIREEYVEFEREVFRKHKERDPDAIRRELVQLAAMCQRAAEDCITGIDAPVLPGGDDGYDYE